VSIALPEGYIEVPVSVLDLDRRLRDGDPTMGWRGDPTFQLVFNQHARVFEVWGRDGRGVDYIVMTCRDGVGPRILADLAASDWQRGKQVLRDVQARSDKKHKDREDRIAETRRAASEKFAWHVAEVFRQDSGHSPGRSVFGQVGRGKKD
jgi:hypothetical protein